MNWIKVIISEMLKGNFSFLILIIGLLQLIVMIRKGKKDKIMTPQVYENLHELNYGELLSAIDRIREKLYEDGVDIKDADMQYYVALMQELDSRQREE
jgi:hypothetical protein